MNDKIIELEEYKNIITNKKNLDNGTTTVDDLSLEELEDVGNLYKREVARLQRDIDILEEKNKELKKLLENR